MPKTAPQNAPLTPAALQNAAEIDAIVAALKTALFDAFAMTRIAEAQVQYDTDGHLYRRDRTPRPPPRFHARRVFRFSPRRSA